MIDRLRRAAVGLMYPLVGPHLRIKLLSKIHAAETIRCSLRRHGYVGLDRYSDAEILRGTPEERLTRVLGGTHPTQEDADRSSPD